MPKNAFYFIFLKKKAVKIAAALQEASKTVAYPGFLNGGRGV